MDSLKIIGPTTPKIAANIAARDRRERERAEILCRARNLSDMITRRIGPGCHFCSRPDLYPARPPGGCPCTNVPTYHNGVDIVATRARYRADWAELTRPVADFTGRSVELRTGRIVSVR